MANLGGKRFISHSTTYMALEGNLASLLGPGKAGARAWTITVAAHNYSTGPKLFGPKLFVRIATMS